MNYLGFKIHPAQQVVEARIVADHQLLIMLKPRVL